MRSLVLLCVVAALCWPSALSAQPPGKQPPGGPPPGGMPPAPPMHMLLYQQAVMNEIKLSPQQLQKVREILSREAGGMKKPSGPPSGPPSGQEFEKMMEQKKKTEQAVADVLKPEQLRRLTQIALQSQGARAFGDPEVAEQLRLTDEQKDKVRGLLDAMAKDLEKLFKAGKPPHPDTFRQKFTQSNKTAADKIAKALTADQRSRWTELTGKAVKGLQLGPPMMMGPPPGPPPGFTKQQP